MKSTVSSLLLLCVLSVVAGPTVRAASYADYDRAWTSSASEDACIAAVVSNLSTVAKVMHYIGLYEPEVSHCKHVPNIFEDQMDTAAQNDFFFAAEEHATPNEQSHFSTAQTPPERHTSEASYFPSTRPVRMATQRRYSAPPMPRPNLPRQTQRHGASVRKAFDTPTSLFGYGQVVDFTKTEVPADGNCFFASLAETVNTVEKYRHQLAFERPPTEVLTPMSLRWRLYDILPRLSGGELMVILKDEISTWRSLQQPEMRRPLEIAQEHYYQTHNIDALAFALAQYFENPRVFGNDRLAKLLANDLGLCIQVRMQNPSESRPSVLRLYYGDRCTHPKEQDAFLEALAMPRLAFDMTEKHYSPFVPVIRPLFAQ